MKIQKHPTKIHKVVEEEIRQEIEGSHAERLRLYLSSNPTIVDAATYDIPLWEFFYGSGGTLTKEILKKNVLAVIDELPDEGGFGLSLYDEEGQDVENVEVHIRQSIQRRLTKEEAKEFFLYQIFVREYPEKKIQQEEREKDLATLSRLKEKYPDA